MAGPSLGEATIDVGANTTKLESDIKKGIDGPLKKAAGTITAIAGGFIAANVVGQAATAVKQFVGDSIAAASRLEESINAVTVSYGEAGDEVLALGETSAEQFGLSEAALNSAAVALAGFTTKIDEADPADAFENILGRATDFASVMNLDVNEALRLFQSGLAGESEPLRKFGIDLSAASVSAFAVESGIVAAGESMTETQKVQARYGLLMESTAKVQGDFANTSDSLANTQRRLSAEWENMQARIGAALLPAMGNVLRTGEKLIPVFEDIATAAVDVATGIAETIQPLLDAIAFLGEYKVQLGETEEQSFGLTDAIKAGIGLFRGDFTTSIDAATVTAENFTDTTIANTEAWYNLTGAIPPYIEQIEAAEKKQETQTTSLGFLTGLMRGAFFDATFKAAGAEKELADKTAEATQRVRDQMDANRAAIDPAFALIEAQRNRVEAEAAVNELIEKGITAGPEWIDATLELAAATLEADSANLEWVASGAEAEEQLRLTLERAGFTKEAIDGIVASIGVYNSTNVNPKDFLLNLVAGTTSGAAAQASLLTGGKMFTTAHTGGVFHAATPGGEGLVLLKDRETVIPADHSAVAAVGAGPITVTINVSGAASINQARMAGRAAAEEVIVGLSKARVSL